MRVCPKCGLETADPFCPKHGIETIDKSAFGDKGELVGKLIGKKYRMLKLLGIGAFGSVYLAHQLDMDRKVAIKLINRKLVNDEEMVKRFSREVHASSKLHHPNTVRIHEFGRTKDGMSYFTMEHLDGVALDQVISRLGRLPEGKVRAIATQILKSLSEAHSLGLVHRDLKPANVMLTRIHGESDFVKVLDFGFAKFVTGDRPDDGLSLAGTGFGTPKYISPEQVRGDVADPRTDIYSLGVVMYEMLSGVPPFDAKTNGRLFLKHVQDAPPPLDPELAVSEGMTTLVMEMLAKDPADRPQTAAEVIARLASLHLPPGDVALSPSGVGIVDTLGRLDDSGPVVSASIEESNRRSPRTRIINVITYLVIFAIAATIGFLARAGFDGSAWDTVQEVNPLTSVEAVIDGHLGEVFKCVGAAQGVPSGTTVTIRFDLGASGGPTTVAVKGVPEGTELVAPCIEAAAATWGLPANEGGEPISVSRTILVP